MFTVALAPSSITFKRLLRYTVYKPEREPTCCSHHQVDFSSSSLCRLEKEKKLLCGQTSIKLFSLALSPICRLFRFHVISFFYLHLLWVRWRTSFCGQVKKKKVCHSPTGASRSKRLRRPCQATSFIRFFHFLVLQIYSKRGGENGG